MQPGAAPKELVLLGGGHAHVQVLRAFAAAPPANTRITLVSPFPELVYSGMVPGLVAGHYTAAECTLALAPLAARAHAAFRQASATAIDAAAQSVALVQPDGTDAVVRYDVLSVDVGGVIDTDAISGSRQHALCVRPIERFIETLAARLRSASSTPSDVVVIGGGAGGFELALALRFRLGAAAHVHLVGGGSPLLPALAPSVRRRAQRALVRRRIVVHQDTCVEIGEDHVRLASGVRIACKLAIVATGVSAPPWLRGSGLALDANGYLATASTLQSLSHRDVVAAGDAASRVDAPRPRSGVYAVRAGPPLAYNLRCALEDRPLVRYSPQRRALSLLSCGDHYAIAAWGGWSCEGRWVWRLKDRIDRRFVGVDRPA